MPKFAFSVIKQITYKTLPTLVITSLHAIGKFICPGKAFAGSLNPDQGLQIFGLYLRSKRFDNLITFLQNNLKLDNVITQNLPSMQGVHLVTYHIQWANSSIAQKTHKKRLNADQVQMPFKPGLHLTPGHKILLGESKSLKYFHCNKNREHLKNCFTCCQFLCKRKIWHNLEFI